MEWNGSLRRWNGMEWSGRKLMSPASGAGETVPTLGASGVVRCLHLSATKHKWRLGEAGLPGGSVITILQLPSRKAGRESGKGPVKVCQK
jgi:hypothetical protein